MTDTTENRLRGSRKNDNDQADLNRGYGMWQRTFLIISGIIELLLLAPALVFTAFLGYHGFTTGEMGTMIGMFSVAILLLLLPYLAARLAVVLGLRRNRRWAAVLGIVLSVSLLLAAMFSMAEFTVLPATLVAYTVLSIYAAVGCIRGFPRMINDTNIQSRDNA
jgi:FlaA1/EpsC-like NDP-sugar epimerase